MKHATLAAEAPEGSSPQESVPPSISGKHGRRTSVRIRLRLGTKITIVVVGLILALGLVTVLVVGSQMRATMMEEFHSKGEGIVSSLANSCEQLLIEDDRSRIQGLIDQFRVISGVRYIAIADVEGEIINHSLSPIFPDALAEAIRAAADDEVATEGITRQEVDLAEVGRVMNIRHPILNGALGWAHVGMDMELIESRVLQLSMRVLLVFGLFLLIGTVLAFGFSQLVVRPLYRMVRVMERVSAGDLRARSEIRTRDELAVLGGTTDSMIESLRQIVSQVRSASVSVTEASTEILGSSQEQESGVAQQSASLEEVSRTMESMEGTARAIADNTAGVQKLAEEVSQSAKAGQESLEVSRASVKRIVEHNEIIADRINKLFQQSQAIISVIDIIDNISDRLDLLALNAALEGSRAGEVGKGFSLVAQEMRRLAENVTDSTKEIKETIQEIHHYTKACIDASERGKAATDEGSGQTEKLVDVMREVFELIEKTTESSRQITVITQQQLSSSQQMVSAMKEVASVAHEGRAAAQQVTRSATDLAGLSSELRERVAWFRLGGDEVEAEEPPAVASAAQGEEAA